jgi:hypothetical protein
MAVADSPAARVVNNSFEALKARHTVVTRKNVYFPWTKVDRLSEISLHK